MTKPSDYRRTYVLAMDVPYRNHEQHTTATHASQGVLHRGRVVWLQHDVPGQDQSAQVSAFAEGVGIVVLDARAVEPMAHH